MKRSVFAIALVLTAGAFAQTPARVSDVIYMKDSGAAFTMDIFRPAKPNGIGMIYLVSGGWYSNHAGISTDLAKQATDRGITVFEVVHGGQPRYKVPEIFLQITRAVRFIRTFAADYGVNANRLGICGASAGGHLSLLLASTGAAGNPSAPDPVDRASATVGAVGIFFPPTDFQNWGKPGAQAFENVFLRSAFGNAFVVDQKTATKEQFAALTGVLSPVTHFTKAMPPTLIVHGDKDDLVPLQQSEVAIAKLKSLGVPCELITVAGKGHGWAEMNVQFQDIFRWFERYLRP